RQHLYSGQGYVWGGTRSGLACRNVSWRVHFEDARGRRRTRRRIPQRSRKRGNDLVAQKKRAGTLAAFIALLYYEFLWNIRKKKIIAIFIIIFAIATVQLAFTPIADALANRPQTLQANSTFLLRHISHFTGLF